MPDMQTAQQMIGKTAVDPDGDKIGTIEQIYVNDDTGYPQWVTVKTGLFGTKESFAPLHGATIDGDDVALTVPKDLVKDAPKLDTDEHLNDADNDALYTHYAGHLDDNGTTAEPTLADNREAAGPSHDENPGPDDANRSVQSTGDEPTPTMVDSSREQATHADAGEHGQDRDDSDAGAGDAMTRSEERVRVGTEQTPSGRARLRKYVVTEEVTTTVPVSHEEVRIDREPITDAEAAGAVTSGDISEDEQEITLHAERPVVEKETVPVETVRLGTETVTEEQTVTEQVRKEQIDAPDVDQR